MVTPIPTPYRDPFWSVVAAEPGVDLQVFYCAAGKGDRPWAGDWSKDFPSEVLPGRNLARWRGPDASLYDNPAISEQLQAGDFDAVLIGGYNHLTLWRAMAWCRRKAVPYYLMCESHLHVQRSPLRRALKAPLVRRAVRHMAGGLPTGIWAEEYLVHYGADPGRMARVPNTPDVVRLASEAKKLASQRETLRDDLGLPDRPTLLFAGRLIRKKGAHITLEALAKIEPEQRPLLVVVGDGPERLSLLAQSSAAGLENDIHWAGFVEPKDMVRWYAAADAFILPSRETWGVVVLEALACGLPVLISDQVGCHPDVTSNGARVGVIARQSIDDWRGAIISVLYARTRFSRDIDGLQAFEYSGVSRRLLAQLRQADLVSDFPKASSSDSIRR